MRQQKLRQLGSFFDGCYNAREGTVNLPLEWTRWFAEVGADAFIDTFNDWVDDRGVPLPGLGRTLPEAEQDFDKLCQLDTTKYVVQQPWQHAFPYRWSLTPVTIAQCRTGNLCSSFFNADHRARTRGHNQVSAWQAWNDPRLRRSALRFFKFKARHDPVALSSATLRGLVGNNVCRASNFSPASAKAVYDMLDAHKVYDFSAGWGDRLLAAMATPSVHTYIGTDPNLDNQEIYDHLIDAFGPRLRRDFFARVHGQPAESFRPAALYGRDFDLAFTSCPYFNCERYAAGARHERLQSWYRYQTCEAWLHGFLFPALMHALECLRPGGILAVNIADFGGRGGKAQRQELCDPMNRFLRQQRCRYLGSIGLLMSSKYGTRRAAGAHKFGEPIWIWQKA